MDRVEDGAKSGVVQSSLADLRLADLDHVFDLATIFTVNVDGEAGVLSSETPLLSSV